MTSKKIHYILLFICFTLSVFTENKAAGYVPGCNYISSNDTLPGNQFLYNGRWWRNIYNMVKEDQFLFSRDFLPGFVSMNGKMFRNIDIRYDIYNDEIMIPSQRGIIVQINKEMVDSFSISYQNRIYYFTKIPENSLKGLKGYLNVLYDDKSSLLVKYRKEIELLAVDKKYDRFFQTYKVYLVKDGIAFSISGKRDFLKLLEDQKIQIKNFIKKNKLKISKNNPESFVPVIRYYDSLNNQKP